MIAAVEPGPDNFSTNVRYYLAKKQMEGLFMKWVAQTGTAGLIQKLIADVQHRDATIVTFRLTDR